MLRVLSALSLGICLATPAWAGLQLVYPAPNTWVTTSDYLVIKTDAPEVTAVRITLNGEASDVLDVGSPEYRKLFRDMVIVRPRLDAGRNQIGIETFRGTQKGETLQATVFFAPMSERSKVPPEFPPFTMHVPAVEKLCAGCHVMNATAEQMNSNVEKKNPCYTCHKELLRQKYVHGPVGTYSCGYCHRPQGTPKYAVPRREAALCTSCHAEKTAEFRKRKFIHGPVEAGECEPCHDVHGSPNFGQLRMPVNQLCLSCHDSVRKNLHVVRTPGGEGHPLRGFQDPSRPGSNRELSCISCHNPHSGDARYFFQNNAENRMALCQMCHNK